MARAHIRFHLPARMMQADHSLPHFYQSLIAGLRARGAVVDLCVRDYDALAAASGADFDFVHNGGVARAQALNLGAAYLPDFYYCDPKGLYFESSICDAPFDHAALNPATTQAFLLRLRQDYVLARRSRYAQPPEIQSFGAGHIAVFLQDWSEPLQRARYMNGAKMVDTILADTGGRPVVIKPHPRNIGAETLGILAQLRAQKRSDVTVTHANIHDILHGAALTVSVSSSAALEGMLHNVPAVLFGRSDLHPCVGTVTKAAEWRTVRDATMAQNWPFAGFLHWFLRRQSIDTKSAFMAKVLGRMATNGADFAALGLNSAD